MRRTRLASLVLLGLLALGACARAGDRLAPKPRAGAAPENAHELVTSWQVSGYGESYADANESALKNAQERVAAFLASEDPTLDWIPPLNYVRTLVANDHESKKEFDQLGKLWEVTLQIDVSGRDVRNMQAQALAARSSRRLLALGKVLAGLVACFAAVGGYFRLEEETKGYYTAWLRLGAIGFVAAVGLALLLIA